MLALGKDFTQSVNRVPLGLLKGKVYTLLRTLASIIISVWVSFVPTPMALYGVGNLYFSYRKGGKKGGKPAKTHIFLRRSSLMNKKYIGTAGIFLSLLIFLSGCSRVGTKSATMTAIYIVTAILSMFLLFGYCFLIKKKEPWFIVLFSAVMVVNVGYLSISVSGTLEEALLANRIAYLGSVFLPVSMLMTILKTCKFKLKKWMVAGILSISAIVFFIAASPGYLDIYYKEVSLVTIDGVSVLEKVYGPLHSVYLYYLLLHFSAMIGIIIYARISKRITSSIHSVVLLGSVIVNIGVWLMEQLVKIDFEFLSVSYIVSELFLLGVSLIIQDSNILASFVIKPEAKNEATPYETPQSHSMPSAETSAASENTDSAEDFVQKCQYLQSMLYTLTPTEKEIYRLYLDGKSTKDIMATLNITENTLKYHNRNIYSKLGVSSRKQLLQIANAIKTEAISK